MTDDGAGGPDAEKKIIPRLEAQRIAKAEAGDDSAITEAKQLSAGKAAEEIAEEAAKNEHQRNERFRDHFERMAIVALWGAFVILFLMVTAWVAHILLPVRYHWLSPEQTAKVQNLVTGGVVAGLAAGHLRKRIGHN